MRLLRTAALLAISAAPLRAQDGALQVLRHAPVDTAGAATIITVTFDRPVAGGLETTIPAERVFRIEPSVVGRAEWRDPVTIRFVPKEPLVPGSVFTVTLDSALRGLDGSRLAEPYRFTFRVRGARLLAWSFGDRPAGDDGVLSPSGRVLMLYSAPVDLARLSARARLELPGCTGATRIPLRAGHQRPIEPTDPRTLRAAGEWDRDTTLDRFRRVVELEPASAPPPDCAGTFVVPNTWEDARYGAEEAHAVRTTPTFRLLPVACDTVGRCSMDEIWIRFSTRVREADVKRHVHLVPAAPLEFHPRGGSSSGWPAKVHLAPRSRYVVVVDSTLRDVYDRVISGPTTAEVVTRDYAPAIAHASGTVIVPRAGARTIPVRHVNVRTLRVISAVLPESQRLSALASAAARFDTTLLRTAGVRDTVLIKLSAPFNVERITEVPLPARLLAARSGVAALRFEIAERVPSPDDERAARMGAPRPLTMKVRSPNPAARPYLVVQLTDLAVHAKAGNGERVVLVTGLADGRPRAGATVKQVDLGGMVLASGVSGPDGIAWLRAIGPESATHARAVTAAALFGARNGTFFVAELDGDQVATPQLLRAMGYEFWSPLDPWQLGGRGGGVPAAAAALYTDRGIYRPGEMLHLGGVVRRGWLGALSLPAASDSVRLTVTYRANRWRDDGEDAVIRDTMLALTGFGTLTDSLLLRPGLPLGSYDAELQLGDAAIAQHSFRVAEYRAPEFLAEVHVDSAPRFAGDTVTAHVSARYLFGGPMGRARVEWGAALYEVQPWELKIPGAEGWTVGEWHADGDNSPHQFGGFAELRADGTVDVHVPLEKLHPSRPGRLQISAAVVDVNRQAVTASTTVPVHPARLYLLARRKGAGWYWTAGQRATVEIRAVTPEGAELGSVPVTVALVRRDRGVNPERADSLLRTDTIRVGRGVASYSFVPEQGGEYEVRLSAGDGHGGTARTTLGGYAASGELAWWSRSPYYLPLVAERMDLAVGDSAKVLFDSPFASAEAWITIEREGILEQRRTVVRRGANVVPLLVSARQVPNVFVSVLLVRRDDAPDQRHPDSETPLVRAGYVELRVKTDVKRLVVSVESAVEEYRPGDTAAVRVRVTDSQGRGTLSEVTLWAVDEGVLALTDFHTPDVLAQLYRSRGVALRLTSTLPQSLMSEGLLTGKIGGQSMLRESHLSLESMVVTGMGMTSAFDASSVSVRREFRSTAFYLGAQSTDDSGRVELHAKLPDNLTTYRLMAVAVGTDDRAGSGEGSLLVSRALVARPTLPRFVRPSDTLSAGAVVNVRDGGARRASVSAATNGMNLRGPAQRSVMLAEGKGAEARFGFVVPARDSAPSDVSVRLRASDGTNGDAVESRLPVRPDFHPRTHAVIGAVRGSVEVMMPLPAGIDRSRSSVTVRIGTSPIEPMLASYRYLRSYRYDCTEQLASRGRALIGVWHVVGDRDTVTLGGDPRTMLQALSDELLRRQRADGAIRYWNDNDWSSPWLTAYAGTFLQEARAQGITVDDGALRRLAVYLARAAEAPIDTGGMNRYQRRDRRLALGGRVALAEYLRMAGLPIVSVEDELLGLAPLMTWEDRLRLAEALATRKDVHARVLALVDAAWASVTVAGNRIDLPDSAHSEREFPSRLAPATRLLTATIALRPSHPLIGGLLETVLQHGRAEQGWAWSTQDHASLVTALAKMSAGDTTARRVRVEQGGRVLGSRRIGAGDSLVALPLDGLLTRGPNGADTLRLTLRSDTPGAPMYYVVSVTEIPAAAPTRPDIKGIVVERWYERFADGQPVTSVKEGELVRVRLRVTVPAERTFVAVEDPLPAGLEPVDLHLRTSGTLQPFTNPESERARMEGDRDRDGPHWQAWLYGRWDNGWWSPWEHVAMYDDRVVYFARMLWPGSYSASYLARATTAGSFVRPPAHAEEMYNPALQGRSDGGRFRVREEVP